MTMVPMNALRATVALLSVFLGAVQPALAHEGHDHGVPVAAVPAAPTGAAPRREADGRIFLPKLSQRQLGVRTQLAQQASLPRTVELMGKVVIDPQAGGQVQALQPGRLEPGPRGLPSLGQRVRRGEVLAQVRPALGAVEMAGQQAQGAELRARLAVAQQRLSRLEQLEGSVPQKEIDAARAEVRGLSEQVTAVGRSLTGVDQLVAPVSGVVAAVRAVAGQVLDARDVVFEIVDPAKLRVEALVFDPAQAADITGGVAQAGGHAVALRLVGAGLSLREGALPVAFSMASKDAGAWAVGQPVRVLASTSRLAQGVPVPAAAVVKGQSGRDIVWVHDKAEVFMPVPVNVQPLDGERVMAVSGLKAGQRVVVQGASLLNQVR